MESAEIVGSNAHLIITVGTAMRDSGNISPNAQIRRLIGDRRFSISSHIGTHGHSRLSNGTIFFGFRPSFNALGVIPGDQITINLDFEKNIAQMNKDLNPDIETIFIITPPEVSHISSSLIRDIIKNGGDVSKFIPKEINI